MVRLSCSATFESHLSWATFGATHLGPDQSDLEVFIFFRLPKTGFYLALGHFWLSLDIQTTLESSIILFLIF